jgi:hypothetical protein
VDRSKMAIKIRFFSINLGVFSIFSFFFLHLFGACRLHILCVFFYKIDGLLTPNKCIREIETKKLITP